MVKRLISIEIEIEIAMETEQDTTYYSGSIIIFLMNFSNLKKNLFLQGFLVFETCFCGIGYAHTTHISIRFTKKLLFCI